MDRWLAERPELPSRETARRLILEGAVRVNGQGARPSVRLKTGDVVEFALPAPVPASVTPEQGELNLLYEDEWLAVVNKPPGLAMHPGPGHPTGTLVNLLLGRGGGWSGIGGVMRPGIVHRLDKDTSGVVVVAKNDLAHGGLAAQFKAHTVEREYAALVVGQPPGAAGTISLPLGRHPTHRLKRRVMLGGKRAVTHWRADWRRPPFTRLLLRLETGRTHQIRVHLAHQGWPVLGDPLYGRARHRGFPFPEPLQAVLEGFRRQALHAGVLGFDHPRDGRRLRFSAPTPADMAAVEQAIIAHLPQTGGPNRSRRQAP